MSNYEMVVKEIKEMYRCKLIKKGAYEKALKIAYRDRKEIEDPDMYSDVTSTVDTILLLANL